MTRIKALLAAVVRLATSLAVFLIGRWRWEPPVWLAFDDHGRSAERDVEVDFVKQKQAE